MGGRLISLPEMQSTVSKRSLQQPEEESLHRAEHEMEKEQEQEEEQEEEEVSDDEHEFMYFDQELDEENADEAPPNKFLGRINSPLQ